MTIQIIRNQEGEITTGNFCKIGLGAKPSGGGSGNGNGGNDGGNGGGGYETPVMYQSNKPDSTIGFIPKSRMLQIQSLYAQGLEDPSRVTLPNDIDWGMIGTGGALVVQDEHSLDVNMSFTKAVPFTVEGRNGYGGFMYNKSRTSDVPHSIAVRRSFVEEVSTWGNQRAVALKIIFELNVGAEEMPITVEDMNYMFDEGNGEVVESGGEWLTPLEIGMMVSMYATNLISFTSEMKLVNLIVESYNSDGTVRDQIIIDDRTFNDTPSTMSDFILPSNENVVSIEFNTDEIASLDVKSSSYYQGHWDHTYRGADQSDYPVLNTNASEHADLQVAATTYAGLHRSQNGYSGTAYRVKLDDAVLSFTKARDMSSQIPVDDIAVAVWIFIPNKKVTIKNTSHPFTYDLKHFSTGTSIYLFIGSPS